MKGNRALMRILPPLILHEADGHFTKEVEALHQGEWPSPAQ
jgi:tRNA1(Val) A37 N6-methylase TrmN6